MKLILIFDGSTKHMGEAFTEDEAKKLYEMLYDAVPTLCWTVGWKITCLYAGGREPGLFDRMKKPRIGVDIASHELCTVTVYVRQFGPAGRLIKNRIESGSLFPGIRPDGMTFIERYRRVKGAYARK